MILWYMFAFAGWVGGSILAGVAEVSFLGSGIAQSPMRAFLEIIANWNTWGGVKVMGYMFTNIPDVIRALVHSFIWDYSILHETVIGQIVWLVLLCVITIPLIVGFFTEVVARLIPGTSS